MKIVIMRLSMKKCINHITSHTEALARSDSFDEIFIEV